MRPNSAALCGLTAFLAVASAASAQQFEVLVETGAGTGVFNSAGVLTPFDDTGKTPAETYNRQGPSYQGTLTPGIAETTNMFVVRNSDDNFHLYLVHGVKDGVTDGAAEFRLDLNGANSAGAFDIEFADDPPDTYGGVPGVFATASQSWVGRFTDGGVWGPLSDSEPWTLDFQFTAPPTGLSAVRATGSEGFLDLGAPQSGLRIRLRLVRTLTLSLMLSPTNDSGLFDLNVNGQPVLQDATHGSSASTTVQVGDTVTLTQVAGLATNLNDYSTSIACGGDGVGSVAGTSSVVFVAPPGTGGVFCTFTSTRLGTPPPPLTTCAATGAAPVVQAEGLAELVGDVVLSCTLPLGQTPAAASAPVRISVSLNVDIANNTIGGAPGSELTDAVLLVNGNNCASPSQVGGAFGTCGAPDPRFQDPQYATRSAANRVEWSGVAFPYPGATPPGEQPFPSTTTLRLTGVRAQVAQLGVPTAATFPSTQVSAFVSVFGDGPGAPAVIPVANNVLNVAVPIAGAPSNQTSPDPAFGVTTCQATAVPPVIRAEGIAELVGDIVLACTTPDPPADPTKHTAQMRMTVSLNTSVTNNPFGGGLTDAVMIVNENNCTTPGVPGCGADPRFQAPQYGRLAASDRLEWDSVAFPIPSAAPPSGFPFPSTTTVRITAIRSDATRFGIPNAATFPSTQVTAFVSLDGQATVSLSNNVLNIAVPILGLTQHSSLPIEGLQCVDGSQTATLTVTEGFATAFKSIGGPTFQSGVLATESGYFAPGSNNGAGATQGTRVLLKFFDFPEGVEAEVPREVAGTSGVGPPLPKAVLRLVSGADANGAGGIPVGGAGTEPVSLANGAGLATYEIVDTELFQIEEYAIDILLSWPADLPAPGVGEIRAMLGPVSDVLSSSSPAPEPRFQELTNGLAVLEISPCSTTLLFPYAVNQFGADTRIAIANPSGFVPGTQPETGSCTLHYHGQTSGGGAAPVDQTSPPLAPGEQLDFTLSGGSPADLIPGAPDFGGYLMAVCDFIGAEGTAIVSDGLGRRTEHDAEQAASGIPVRTPDTKTLLFAHLSNQGGRDAQIVLSNTTRDWLGTTEEAGACTLGFFGQNAPAPLATGPIPAGEQVGAFLSSIAPGFEGAVAVTCGFSLARGVARQFGTTPEAYALGVDPILVDPPGTTAAPSTLLFKRVVSNAGFDTTYALFNHGVSTAQCVVDVRNRPNLPAVPLANITLGPGEFVANQLSDLGVSIQGFLTATCDQPDVYGSAHTLSNPGSRLKTAHAYNAEPLDLPRDEGPAPFVIPFLEQNGSIDRQISIVNTTADGLGTTPQNGACTVKHFGASSFGAGPLPDRLLTIPAGEYRTYTLLDSVVQAAGLTDLTGFAVVDCDFPHARSYDTRADR